MKSRITALLLAVLLVLLAACTAAPAETTAPIPTETAVPTAETTPSAETTAPTPTETAAPSSALTESSAWRDYGSTADALGIIVNEPFDRELTATDTWLDGEYERAYIIPRYVGSYVNLYPITWDDTTYTELIGDKAVQSTLAADGCIIYSALVRPEGVPQWYVEIQAPDGSVAGLVLSYNGNTGTPAEELLCADAAE